VGKARVTSIRIDEDVFREAKELGLNVSKISENALKEAIRRLKGVNSHTKSNILHSHKSDGVSSENAVARENKLVARERFELSMKDLGTSIRVMLLRKVLTPYFPGA